MKWIGLGSVTKRNYVENILFGNTFCLSLIVTFSLWSLTNDRWYCRLYITPACSLNSRSCCRTDQKVLLELSITEDAHSGFPSVLTTVFQKQNQTTQTHKTNQPTPNETKNPTPKLKMLPCLSETIVFLVNCESACRAVDLSCVIS